MTKQSKNLLKIVVVICIATLTAFATISQADDWGCGGEHCSKHQSHNFKKLAQKLGLTDAQKAQAKAIFNENKDVVKLIYTSLHAEQKKLKALMHAATVDEAAIRAETVKLAGIQADLNINRAKVLTQFHAILALGQQAMLKTLLHKGHQRDCTKIVPVD
jgi:Spy/CpxP family protein refolding chaperone